MPLLVLCMLFGWGKKILEWDGEKVLKKISSALSFQRAVILKFNPGHKHEDDIAEVTVCHLSVYLTRYRPKNIRERANKI